MNFDIGNTVTLLEKVGLAPASRVHISDSRDLPGIFFEDHGKAAPEISLDSIRVFDNVATINQCDFVAQKLDFVHLEFTGAGIGRRTTEHAFHGFA